jgi:Flp pilus assembly protein TadG
MMKSLQQPLYKQKGLAAVEFALIGSLFFILLLGIVEMARVLLTWNSAVEATRYGARIAAVCTRGEKAPVLSRMQRIMPNLADSNLSLTYLPSGCDDVNSYCQQVKVSLTNYQVTTHIPVIGTVLTALPFTTTLPRELMNSAGNPACTVPGVFMKYPG